MTNTPTNAKAKIMLIDDDLVDRMACKRLLESHKVSEELHCFSDAQSALQSLEASDGKDAPLILLDVNMPRMNGLEFLEAVYASQKITFSGTVAVMISVHLTDALRASFEKMPCVHGFVQKPLNKDELIAAGIISPRVH